MTIGAISHNNLTILPFSLFPTPNPSPLLFHFLLPLSQHTQPFLPLSFLHHFSTSFLLSHLLNTTQLSTNFFFSFSFFVSFCPTSWFLHLNPMPFMNLSFGGGEMEEATHIGVGTGAGSDQGCYGGVAGKKEKILFFNNNKWYDSYVLCVID